MVVLVGRVAGGHPGLAGPGEAPGFQVVGQVLDELQLAAEPGDGPFLVEQLVALQPALAERVVGRLVPDEQRLQRDGGSPRPDASLVLRLYCYASRTLAAWVAKRK